MLTSVLLVAIIVVPGAIEAYFAEPSNAEHEEYIPDGR